MLRLLSIAMLNFRFIFLFGLIAFPFVSNAQNDARKEIEGKLLSISDDLFLESVYIYNKQSGKGRLSDSSGDFTLSVREGDTISVSALQIKSVEMVIEKMHINDAFITLNVEPSMEYLEEILLSNRSLTGNLDLDMKNIPLEPVVTSLDLGFGPPKYDMTKGERLMHSAGSSPIEYLMAVLSGNLAQIKRRITIEERQNKIRKITSKMPTSFYVNQLKIPRKNVPHFLEFCESINNIDRIVSMELMDFVEFMQQIVVEYKEVYPERF